MDRIACSWCKFQNETDATSCGNCGAPLDAALVVSDSGWREAPRLKDMAEFRFGASTCQIAGEVVPVAEFNLADADGVFFEHHTLLWKEPNVSLAGRRLGGGLKRRLGGMPYAVTQAQGPGRIAFSRDASGEVVVLPLAPEVELDVRGHSFLAASHNISYDFIRIKGLRNIMHSGEGMYMDRFISQGEPGLLLLHGYGNVFERQLSDGESILLEPGGFLYKDSSVTMNTQKIRAGTTLVHENLFLAEMVGPGRVGLQSMYFHMHTD